MGFACVYARFSEASQELVEEGVHRWHTGNDSEKIRLGCTPIETGGVVICEMNVSIVLDRHKSSVVTYMLGSEC